MVGQGRRDGPGASLLTVPFAAVLDLTRGRPSTCGIDTEAPINPQQARGRPIKPWKATAALTNSQEAAMFKSSASSDQATRKIMERVASESKPYTDPRAKYPIAEQARNAQMQGTQRRRP